MTEDFASPQRARYACPECGSFELLRFNVWQDADVHAKCEDCGAFLIRGSDEDPWRAEKP